jgi:hypothetical protein
VHHPAAREVELCFDQLALWLVVGQTINSDLEGEVKPDTGFGMSAGTSRSMRLRERMNS